MNVHEEIQTNRRAVMSGIYTATFLALLVPILRLLNAEQSSLGEVLGASGLL